MIRTYLFVATVGMFITVQACLCSEYRPYIATRLAKAVMLNDDVVPDEDDKAICDGSGYIVHGDGHRTPCPGCSACRDNNPTPVIPNQEVCQCGCGQIGCTCQAEGNSGACAPSVLMKEEEAKIDALAEALEKAAAEAEAAETSAVAAEQAAVVAEAAAKTATKAATKAAEATEVISDELPPPLVAAPQSDLMIYYLGADWCPACVRLKNETLADPILHKFVIDNGIKTFVFKAENPDHKKYFDYYSIGSIPVLLIVDKTRPDKPLKRIVGFISTPTLIQSVRDTQTRWSK